MNKTVETHLDELEDRYPDLNFKYFIEDSLIVEIETRDYSGAIATPDDGYIQGPGFQVSFSFELTPAVVFQGLNNQSSQPDGSLLITVGGLSWSSEQATWQQIYKILELFTTKIKSTEAQTEYLCESGYTAEGF